MTLMKAKKPLALLLALLAALSLLGTTALAAGLPEETIAAQTELCGEDCGHTHEEVFSQTEHTEESLPESEEIAVPVATPLLEQPEPEGGQPSDTSGVIPGSGIYWELNEYGWLMLSGNGSCPTFVSPDDQPWAAVREQITQVWFEDMDALCIPSLAYWFTGCTALTMAEIPYTTPVIGAAAFADCPSLRQIQLYYSGAFTIVPGAFSTGSLTPLLVLFIPEYDSVLGTLAAYDWTEDRRAAYFEDVYGITLLATGYCCFGCQKSGDVIDLAAQLLRLTNYEAAKRLSADFGITDEVPTQLVRTTTYEQTRQFHEDEQECYLALLGYFKLLKLWEQKYQPTSQIATPDPRFIEACQMKSYVEYLCDIFITGSTKERVTAIRELKPYLDELRSYTAQKNMEEKAIDQNKRIQTDLAI